MMSLEILRDLPIPGIYVTILLQQQVKNELIQTRYSEAALGFKELKIITGNGFLPAIIPPDLHSLSETAHRGIHTIME